MSRRIVCRRSTIHGNGVFAATDLEAGITLIQYKGRMLTHKQADRVYPGAETGHTFLFILNERYVLDANVDGNVARWINHSCDPNCRAVMQEDEGGDKRKDKILIETARKIREGEELTYDYGITLDQRQSAEMKRIWACRCGKPNCTGTMLKPKKRKKAQAAA